jgi:cobalamin biosynthesis Mg chelatase CobN
MCLQQQAKHQGSPWKSPGLKPSSPRVSRLPGFEPRLLEPEELAWDSSSDVPPSSSSPLVGHDDTSSEARAAPKEADPESGAQSQIESARGSHGGQVKKSKGSAQKQAGSSRGLTQGSGLQRGEGGRGCAASAARRSVAKVHRSQSLAVSMLMDVVMQHAFVAKCCCIIIYCKMHGSTNKHSRFQSSATHSLICFWMQPVQV